MQPPFQGSLFESEACAPSSTSLFERMSQVLKDSTHPYAQKDLRKAKTATKFIGRGSSTSSTNKYRKAAGDLANCGRYVADDIVFVSAEGARRQRLDIDRAELALAVQASVTFITDAPADRNRPYNVGERDVAAFLQNQGYGDDGQGHRHKR